MKDLFGYIKLGRLSKAIADKIERKPADIYIEYNVLEHIRQRRGDYLKTINLNPISYVQKIITEYTEIRTGKNDALLLVAKFQANNKINTAAIELQLIASKNIYVVKTAMLREKGMRASETILWNKICK